VLWLSKSEHVEEFRHVLRHIKSYWGNRKILRVNFSCPDRSSRKITKSFYKIAKVLSQSL
jgi:dihydroorotate dehydrogenase